MTAIQAPYTIAKEKVIKHLQSNIDKGLSKEQVEERQLKYGLNEIKGTQHRSWLAIFLEQFTSPLVWVLAGAAILAMVFQEWLEGSAILVVILINAGIGFFMEFQAQKSMDALRKLSPSFAHVIREGVLLKINTKWLVPGDILSLEAGDMVPADGRILETHNLAVSEAALTGESIQVSKHSDSLLKDTLLADQKNLVFKGTVVTRGNGKAIITHTGNQTQLGQIARLTQEATKSSTPLEKKLQQLSHRLIGLTILLAGLVFLVGVLQGRDLFLMIETAIALAVAAIPEGLPIVATIALARGMLRLAKYQVIVKELNAVETLGETEIILTDKTGTLTKNQMSVDTLLFDFGSTTIADTYLQNTFAFDQLQKVAALCNNAVLSNGSNTEAIGDPLEIALLQFAVRESKWHKVLQKEFARIKEIPFDSSTKMMATLHKNGRRPDYLVCLKGALEVVLAESDYVLTKDGKSLLTNREYWINKANELAAQGMRVLAFAYSEIEQPKEDFTHNLIFIGCIGFIDPPREDISAAIQTCREAGIKVVMVTGDHPATAKHIALKTSLIDNENEPVIHGRQLKKLDHLASQELTTLQQTHIFARVNPEQKLDLVSFYQQQGKTVGMTGDGINDTPALKKADIGIAMGQRGTEAAKEVADLVLEDDAFSSIVLAIKQGRGIFENIRHFVVYLLSCNLSELLVVSMAFFSNLTMPLLPLQILFINMITDVFPALALGMNKSVKNVMTEPPRGKDIPIVSSSMWIAIIVYALGITIASLSALIFATYYLQVNDATANNFAFYTLILAQLWHVLNLPKANESFFKNEVTTNSYVWWALGGCVVLVVGAYAHPLMREILHLAPFTWEYLGYVIGFSFFPIAFVQFFKRLRLIR